MLCECSSLLDSIERELPVTRLRIDFSKDEPLSQLNGLFTPESVQDIRDGKDYQCIDMMFPFICTYVDRTTVYIEDNELTRENTM